MSSAVQDAATRRGIRAEARGGGAGGILEKGRRVGAEVAGLEVV